MIIAENIIKSFGSQEVLKDISFTGSVKYHDLDICCVDNTELRELRMEIGMLFQGNALFDSLTVEENIRFPLDMFTKQGLKEKRKQVNYCLERVNTAITIDDLISSITKDNNITTVINTHDMNSVMEIGDNICLLSEGHLAWQGNKDEVLSSKG